MSVIKSPIHLPKNETIQLRVPQQTKFRLERYAEFIRATSSYVVVETLERLFKKDAEFKIYLASHKDPEPKQITEDESLYSTED